MKVKERVPDYFLTKADQVVNVDLSSEDLQERMRAGKVYPPDRAARALDNFFTDANLSRLRELALEEIAQLLDRRRQRREAGEPAGSERVMVCLSSRSPATHRLLRKAARLADRFNAPWYAVYVKTPAERPDKIDAATQRQITDTLTLAQQLGGLSMPYGGRTFAGAVAEFVREYGITHVVLGRSLRPWYRRWFGQSPLDRVLREVTGVDIVVVDTSA